MTRGAFSSTILLFSSSNFTANKNLSLGILDSIKKRSDAGERIERKHFVDSTKYLNQMGAVTILDTLSREKTTDLIDKFFNKKYGPVNTTSDDFSE